MKIAITGHRPKKLGNDYDLKSPLIKKIKARIMEIVADLEPDYLISGMALGIDTLFATIALDYKLKLIAAVPCRNQDALWKYPSKVLYKHLLEYADQVHYISEEYTLGCMQERNEWMVDNCDTLIAVWDKSLGGTANCIDYAKEKKKPIIYINPNDFIN